MAGRAAGRGEGTPPSRKAVVRAARTGDGETVRRWHALDPCVGPDTILNGAGDNLLLLACRHRQPGIVRQLHTEHGYSLEAKNGQGHCALHEAVLAGSLDTTAYLLAQGVAVDAMKHADWTALQLACSKPASPESDQIVLALLGAGASTQHANKDGWLATHVACKSGRVEALKALLAQDSESAARHSNNGRTPLMTAALHGYADVMQALLDACPGLDVNAQDCSGWTALHSAVTGGSVAATSFLLEHGALLDAQDVNERVPVHLAAQAGDGGEYFCTTAEEAAANLGLLLDAQPGQLSRRDKHGLCPIHLAATEVGEPVVITSHRGHGHLLRLLLRRGDDANALDAGGNTPLHLACLFSRAQAVSALLDGGADRQALNAAGKSPLDLARSESIRALVT